jgi:hypothetical protein
MATTYKGLSLPVTSEVGWQTIINDNTVELADRIAAPSWLPAETGLNQAGSGPSTIGAFPNQVRFHSLVNGATTGAYWIFQVPIIDNVAYTGFTARPMWYPSASDAVAHTVRWQIDAKQIQNALNIGGAGIVVPWTGISAVRSANVTVLETGQASTGMTFNAALPGLLRFAVSRIGGDALDTYVGDVQLLGVQVDYF